MDIEEYAQFKVDADLSYKGEHFTPPSHIIFWVDEVKELEDGGFEIWVSRSLDLKPGEVSVLEISSYINALNEVSAFLARTLAEGYAALLDERGQKEKDSKEE